MYNGELTDKVTVEYLDIDGMLWQEDMSVIEAFHFIYENPELGKTIMTAKILFGELIDDWGVSF